MKKLFALVLAFCLVLTMLPAPAFAEGEPEAPVCTCGTACTAEKKNTACPVCGAEGATPENCGKYAAPEPTAAQKVQTLIDALPDAVTAENREAVEVQLTAIDGAKLPLTDEEWAALDFAKYDAAIAAINVLDNQPGAEVPKSIPDEDDTFYVHFYCPEAAGNEDEIATWPVDDKGIVEFPPDPAATGYEFLGWYTKPNGEGNKVTESTIFTEDTDLYAYMKPIYTITLDPNGGTVSSTTVTTNAEGKLSPYPVATRDGYEFDCWYTQPSDGDYINSEHVFTENTTLYAHWLELIPEIGFSMSGYGNGQTISGLKLTLDKGNKGVTSDYSQYGVNYWISQEKWGTAIEPSEKFSGEKTYYLAVKVTLKEGYSAGRDANFTLNGNGHEASYTMDSYVYTVVFPLPTVGYVITFDPNGGKLPEGTDSTVATNADGKLTSLPTPTREGYSFDGWSTEKDSGEKVTVDKTYSENTTLYARWKANTYTVHFDANGGTGTMADQTMTCNKSEGLKANAFTLEGHIFRGWNTQPDATGAFYADGETVQNLTTEKDTVVTLFAQWELIVNEVNLTLSGHEIDKRVDVVKLTSEEHITFNGAYGSAWGIATNKNTLKTQEGKVFQADTQYYLWVIFSPEEGCTLEGLTDKDVNLDGTAALSLEDMQGSKMALFRLPVIYTVTVTAGKNGSVSSDSTINAKGIIAVFEGEDVTIQITPDSGYVVYRLTVDGENVKTARSYTFENIQQSHTLKARFLKNGTNAKTGDSFPLVPAIAVLTLSAAALVAVVVIAKKKKKK